MGAAEKVSFDTGRVSLLEGCFGTGMEFRRTIKRALVNLAAPSRHYGSVAVVGFLRFF